MSLHEATTIQRKKLKINTNRTRIKTDIEANKSYSIVIDNISYWYNAEKRYTMLGGTRTSFSYKPSYSEIYDSKVNVALSVYFSLNPQSIICKRGKTL